MIADLKEVVDVELELLIEGLYSVYRYDFRNYSRNSLKRRLASALPRFECETISHLQAKVLHDPALLSRLIDMLTVPTTEMFRDPEYFRSLRENIIPFLKTYPSLKIWIAGCSTGEEVYSIAILLKEEGLLDKTILYATDINVHALEKAKRGIYSADVLNKAGQNYRASGGTRSFADYATFDYGVAKMDQSLIKNVVFSDHSLATDEVFAEVQFVSCRNVLIYFDRDLQNRAIGLFKNSLVRGGFLGLGNRESMRFMNDAQRFKAVNEEHRLYQKV